MTKLTPLIIFCFISLISNGQAKNWTETDRQYLLENLIRSKEVLIKETANLSKAQWQFKESPDRWSINEVVEHIGIWEMLLMHEISRAIAVGPLPDKIEGADSLVLAFLLEEKSHIAVEYTKPFTYTVPQGLDDGKNNLTKVTNLRNQSIDYLKVTKENLRLYFRNANSKYPKSVHQTFISIFGHADRHIRQIQKIKQHKNYPK